LKESGIQSTIGDLAALEVQRRNGWGTAKITTERERTGNQGPGKEEKKGKTHLNKCSEKSDAEIFEGRRAWVVLGRGDGTGG
jgi:hypothetical protein